MELNKEQQLIDDCIAISELSDELEKRKMFAVVILNAKLIQSQYDQEYINNLIDI